MNIRLSEGEIRFRVTTQEFEKLNQGDCVQLETIPLTFLVIIAKKPLDQAMTIDLSSSAIQLAISPEEMNAFKSRLPSKHGIEKTLSLGMGKSIDVAFEVDVRTKEASASLRRPAGNVAREVAG